MNTPTTEPTPPPTDDDGGNIRQALKKRTERVPLRALERRGYKSVQVLDMSTIERIVGDAVETCLDRRGDTVADEARAGLEREAKEEFLKLLADHKRLAKQKTEDDKQREAIEKQLGDLKSELAKQKATLAKEKSWQLDDGITFSPGAFVELETRLRDLFKKLMSDEQRRSLAEMGPRALRGLNDFEKELASMVGRLLSDERTRYLERERKAHTDKVSLLERRIVKLNKALSTTEGHLYSVMQLKGIDPGVASIYDSIQGLDAYDPNYGRKKELLLEVFLENLEIQGREVLESDRNPHAPAQPKPATPTLKAPSGFLEPSAPVTTDTAF